MNGSLKTVQWAMSQKWCLLLFKCCSMRMLKLSFDNRLGASRKLGIFHQWFYVSHLPLMKSSRPNPSYQLQPGPSTSPCGTSHLLYTVIMASHYFIIEFSLQANIIYFDSSSKEEQELNHSSMPRLFILIHQINFITIILTRCRDFSSLIISVSH